ncbi:MAG: 30S ribosomal protein S20 [Holosporales bacterium]|jgi:small subunit ribosomal protein S20|nr:30S ribosomal protein S20 [Holosporales bacterium]
MIIHKSAIKRARQNLKRNNKNRERSSRIRTILAKFNGTISSGLKENIVEDLRNVQSELMIAVNKGVIVKKAAARNISKLTRKAKSVLG